MPVKVEIEYVNEHEPRRAANDVKNVLGTAHWNITGYNRTDDDMPEGVTVEIPHPTFPATADTTAREKPLRDAADALIGFLTSIHWKAVPGITLPIGKVPPPGTLRVLIGARPQPYFDPEFVKEAERRIKETEERIKRQREEMEKERETPPRPPR